MNRCPRCCLRTSHCLCAEIPRIETRTRIVIVRHNAELHKPSNSGRLAAAALTNCALLEYAARDRPFDDRELREEGTWLLFPASAAATAPPQPPPRRLVILDATWGQARRMHQRISALRGMPTLALPPPATPPEQLRTPPRADGLATIESIARALELLEGPAVAEPLDRIYAIMVARSRATARRRPPSRLD